MINGVRGLSWKLVLWASGTGVLFTAWLSVVAQSRTQSSAEASFVLERGRAGQFELGMTVDEALRFVGREQGWLVAAFPEGMFQPELEIQLPGHKGGPALVATIREFPCLQFAFWGISVHDPRFRTRDGLGVGSTLGDLKRRYAAAKVTNIDSDGGPVVFIAELGLTFAIGGTRSFTDAALVTSVWVVPQPVAVRSRRCPERIQ